MLLWSNCCKKMCASSQMPNKVYSNNTERMTFIFVWRNFSKEFQDVQCYSEHISLFLFSLMVSLNYFINEKGKIFTFQAPNYFKMLYLRFTVILLYEYSGEVHHATRAKNTDVNICNCNIFHFPRLFRPEKRTNERSFSILEASEIFVVGYETRMKCALDSEAYC